MGGKVLVALLVTGILGDEVEVFAADDQGTCGLSVFCHDIYHVANPENRVCFLAKRWKRNLTYGASWWRRQCR